MDDRELDGILRDIGRRRFVPSERLIWRTISAIRGRRLLRIVAFLSFVSQFVTMTMTLCFLMSPEIEPVVRTFLVAGLAALCGAIAVGVIAARTRIVWFFQHVEHLTG